MISRRPIRLKIRTLSRFSFGNDFRSDFLMVAVRSVIDLGFGLMEFSHCLLVLCLWLTIYNLHMSWLISFIGKWCHQVVSGVLSSFDFIDLWDEKLCSCAKCLVGLLMCKMSILRILDVYVIQKCHHFEVGLSDDGFRDCAAESDDFVDCCEFDDGVELFWDCEEDGVFGDMDLREIVELEKRRADAAVVELEKERQANASATEEAMSMILRLQNEKSLIEIEAHNYKKMAEQKMLYDEETICSLRFLVLKHQSEQRVLEGRLRLCRQKLKLYSQESEMDEYEGHITFPDFTMDRDNCYK